MTSDEINVAGLYVMLYGWVLVWPAGRWGLRLTGKRYRVLGWIFGVGVVMSAASHASVWHAHAIQSPDAWMAWLFPQLVGAGVWIATAVAAMCLLVSAIRTAWCHAHIA